MRVRSFPKLASFLFVSGIAALAASCRNDGKAPAAPPQEIANGVFLANINPTAPTVAEGSTIDWSAAVSFKAGAANDGDPVSISWDWTNDGPTPDDTVICNSLASCTTGASAPCVAAGAFWSCDASVTSAPYPNGPAAIFTTLNIDTNKGAGVEFTQSVPVTVTNAAPSVSGVVCEDASSLVACPIDLGGNPAPNEGEALKFPATFSDPALGTLDANWLVEWDFDYDGSTFNRQAWTSATAEGTSDFDTPTISHTYGTPGTRVVAVRVTDQVDSVDGSGNPTVRAGSLTSTIFTLTVDVQDVAPTANDDAYTTSEDTPLDTQFIPASVLDNDTDPGAETLTAFLVAPPANGFVTLRADGTFLYTPNANFNGSDSFQYQAYDGFLFSAAAQVDITVTAVNDPPVANDDSASTRRNAYVDVAVTVNDTDVEGDPLTVTAVGAPANGTALVLPGSVSVRYIPNSGFAGADSFTYTITDGNGGFATANVNVTVDPAESVYVSSSAAFNYRDTSSGTTIDLGDDGATTVAVPFPIHFADNPAGFTSLHISNNGTLNFDGQNGAYFNEQIPNSTFDTLIAPFWDDLITNGAGKTRYVTLGAAPSREFVVEWINEDHFSTCGAGTITFQVVFFEESPNILFQYLDTTFGGSCGGDDDGGNATVGIQVHAPGTPGNWSPFSFNTPSSVHAGDAILWTTVPDNRPVADSAPVITDEDTPVAFTLGASDADGDPINFTLDSFPVNGGLSGAAPFLTYSPAPNYNG
ncbi:MAG TPA: Ig-like domain-containing protein, partial [bacterium]|nr:Ig-like domain-containing protein [bacterium]